MSKKLVTPEFRVSYPNIFKARKNDLNGREEYSVVALFAKGADLKALQDLCLAALTEKFGADQKKWPANLRTPFRDQADRGKTNDAGKVVLPDGYEAGAKYVNFKSNQRPGLVDRAAQPILDSSEFYPGCYARATVTAKAYDQAGNRGVSLYLQNLQKTRDGQPFGTRAKAEDDFAPIHGDAETGQMPTASDLFS